MITRVRLENWKAYRNLEIFLDAGTTFLVAANGVGKSSFLDAVKWALDRQERPEKAFMRRTTTSSTVEVDVIIGDDTYTITRSLTAGRAKNPKVDTKASKNGQPADTNATFDRLTTTWRAENAFMLRAAFLSDQFVNENPDLRRHLIALHALDNAQAAIAALTPAAKLAMAEADNTRKGAAANAEVLEQAESRVQDATDKVASATEHVNTTKTKESAAQEALLNARAAAAAAAAHQAWMTTRDTLRADAEQALSTLPADTPLAALLRTAEEAAKRQLAQVSEERARLTERVAAVDEALERLHDADADCPVCRRPLDDDSRAHAERLHSQDRDAATQQLSNLDVSVSATYADQLRDLRERAESLGEEPAAPAPTGPTVTDAEHAAAQAASDWRDAVAAEGAAKEAVRHATHALAELAASTTEQSAVTLYARAAILEAARDALEDTITNVLDAQLGPVSEEVNRRWEAIFPDRPGLRVGPDGQPVRTFDDDEEDLPYAQFSAGEKMVSKLMLRLATLTATTDIPFCWIDEPLEHLDPDARRFVARTLAFMPGTSGLRQIFVTTYEEPLAVNLTVDAPADVRLIFLQAAPIAS